MKYINYICYVATIVNKLNIPGPVIHEVSQLNSHNLYLNDYTLLQSVVGYEISTT